MAKIKLIDDDVELLEDAAFVLRNAGHEVSTQDSTEDAVANLVRDPPDVLVLDVMFPDNPAGGFDLARKIRSTEAIKDLPILLLTNVNQEFPMDFSAGDIDPEWMPVQDLLEKPVRPATLIKRIDRLLSGRP